MAYAIYRAKKIKTAAKLAQTCRHNLREQQPTHSDPHGEIRVLTGSEDAAADVLAMLPPKRRKDAVLCMELLLTASPEYFRPHAPEQRGLYSQCFLDAWQRRAEAWLQEQFGDNVVSAVLHLDEATPHIQALVVPLDRKTGRLAAKRLFGPEALKDQQDTYAEAMADIGLQRGEPGSKAKHEPLRRYYQRAMSPLPEPPQPPPRKKPEPPPEPGLIDKAKEALGMQTAHALAVENYERELAAYEMNVMSDEYERRQYFETLAAKAREYESTNDVARHRAVLTKLRDEIRKQPAEKIEAALQEMPVEDRATIKQLLADQDDDRPGPGR